MTVGTSLVLIAVGAILKFAVTATVAGLNIATIGVILMVVGAIGLVLSVIWLTSHRARGVRTERTVYRDRDVDVDVR